MDWLNKNRRRRDHIRCIQIFVQLHIIDEAIQRSCFYQIVNQILKLTFKTSRYLRVQPYCKMEIRETAL